MHSYILKDPSPECEHCQCILTVRHILVEYNHFTEIIFFGGRDVVESYRFHPTLILCNLKKCQFYIKKYLYISDNLFLHSSLHCIYNLVNFCFIYTYFILTFLCKYHWFDTQ